MKKVKDILKKNKEIITVNTSLLDNAYDKDVEIFKITANTSIWEIIKNHKGLKLRLGIFIIIILVILI